MEHSVTLIALVGIVIVVASLISGVVERAGVPVVAALLALGAALGPYGIGAVDIGLGSPTLAALSTLGLTLVLFSDAVTLELSEVRERGRLAWRLLGPGTLAVAALIAIAAWALLDLPAPAAIILGAALASTDPVLLRTVLRSRALPAPVRTGLRLESGMNDVALLPIVVFAIVTMKADAAAAPLDRAEIARHAFGLLVLGPALGALVGWVGILSLARVRDRVGVRRDYESLYALGLAFGAYAAAESVGGSGFLAAFAAGLVVASQDVELCDCFLEYGEATAEMLLLLTFVALGASAIWSGLAVIDGRTLALAVVALFARTAVLLPMLGGLGLEPRDRRLIALFGPRGLSSLLFVLLAVFAGVPGAERLFAVTCLVVLLSVAIHGVGIAIFLRRRSRRGAVAGGGTEAVVAPEPASRVEQAWASAEASGAAAAASSHAALPVLEAAVAESGTLAAPEERITLDEVRAMMERGEPVTIVDARTERNLRADPMQAQGAVRLPPDDPVQAATALRLTQRGTLVVYCA